MSVIDEKQDLRIRKTRRALKDALFSLLARRKFDRITVNDLCEEALISRTAFYAHFEDKYALLSFLFEELRNDIEGCNREYDGTRKAINIHRFIQENEKIVKNLVDESNAELMHILIDLFTKDTQKIICADEEPSVYDQALIAVCAGGFSNLLIWQIKNNFPMKEVDLDGYVDRILKALKDSRGMNENTV